MRMSALHALRATNWHQAIHLSAVARWYVQVNKHIVVHHGIRLRVVGIMRILAATQVRRTLSISTPRKAYDYLQQVWMLQIFEERHVAWVVAKRIVTVTVHLRAVLRVVDQHRAAVVGILMSVCH